MSMYTVISLQRIITTLTAWQKAAEDSLDRESEKDTPNDERIERYENRIGALEAAIDALSEIEE